MERSCFNVAVVLVASTSNTFGFDRKGIIDVACCIWNRRVGSLFTVARVRASHFEMFLIYTGLQAPLLLLQLFPCHVFQDWYRSIFSRGVNPAERGLVVDPLISLQREPSASLGLFQWWLSNPLSLSSPRPVDLVIAPCLPARCTCVMTW